MCGKAAIRTDYYLECYFCKRNWGLGTTDNENIYKKITLGTVIDCISKSTGYKYSAKKILASNSKWYRKPLYAWQITMDKKFVHEFMFEDFIDMFEI